MKRFVIVKFLTFQEIRLHNFLPFYVLTCKQGHCRTAKAINFQFLNQFMHGLNHRTIQELTENVDSCDVIIILHPGTSKDDRFFDSIIATINTLIEVI